MQNKTKVNGRGQKAYPLTFLYVRKFEIMHY